MGWQLQVCSLGVGHDVYLSRFAELGICEEDFLVSIGFCGALDRSLRIGDILHSSSSREISPLPISNRSFVPDVIPGPPENHRILGAVEVETRFTETGCRHDAFPDLSPHSGGGTRLLLNADSVVSSASAKSNIALQHPDAVAVDMESFIFAKAVRSVGCRGLLVRAVSDVAGEDFPVPENVLFDQLLQRTRTTRLLAWLSRHPWNIPKFLRFVRNTHRARISLNQAAIEILRKQW